MKCLLPLFFFGDIKSTFIIAFSSGWPFRLSYGGRVAKHRIEVKKAVFCESTSQVQIVFYVFGGFVPFMWVLNFQNVSLDKQWKENDTFRTRVCR